MEIDDIALSDVHLGNDFIFYPEEELKRGTYNIVRTRFEFIEATVNITDSDQSLKEDQASSDLQPGEDEDGDLVVVRKQSKVAKDVIVLEHTLGTRLSDVGLQVWAGALLLSDFILYKHQDFDGCSALELGGGVGLSSITMATMAKQVICTDIGDDVLETCCQNADINQHLYKYGQCGGPQSIIKVRQLNWLDGDLPTDTHLRFVWREADLEQLRTIKILMAADVIYSDDLTDGFFRTVQKLLSQCEGGTLYVALERRLNFTMDKLEVSCPAYQHFCHCLTQLEHSPQRDLEYQVQQIDASFPQHFEYERTKFLELWKIEANLKRRDC